MSPLPRAAILRTLTLPGVSVSLDALTEWLRDAAEDYENPQVSVSVYRAGNDPRESDYATLTITEGPMRVRALARCEHVDPVKGQCIKPDEHVESGSSGIAAHDYNPRGSVNG